MTAATNNGYGFECYKYEALLELLPGILEEGREKYLSKKSKLKTENLHKDVRRFAILAAKDFLKHFELVYQARPDKIRFGDDPITGDVSDIKLFIGDQSMGSSDKWHSTEIKTLRLSKNKLSELGFTITPKLQSIINFLSNYETWADAKSNYGNSSDSLLADINSEFGLQFQNLQNPSDFIQFLFGDCDYLIYRVTQNKPNLLNRKILTPKLKPTQILAVQPSAKTRDTISIVFDKGWQVSARLKNKNSEINHRNIFGSLDYKIDLINCPEFGDVL